MSPLEPLKLLEKLVQRHASLLELGDEAAEHSQAPSGPLGPFQVLDWFHVHDGRNLLGVDLDAALRDDETQQLSRGDSEHKLLRVELDVVGLEIGESLLKVYNQLCSLVSLLNDVIDIDLQVSANLLVEALLHTSLEGCPGVS